MSSYTLVDRLGKMPVLEHYLYGPQIWTQITTRKDHRCAICRIDYGAGDGMFSPVTRAEGHQVQVQISGESLPFQKHDGEQWMYTEVGDAKAHE